MRYSTRADTASRARRGPEGVVNQGAIRHAMRG
jgi:hypothetical protein